MSGSDLALTCAGYGILASLVSTVLLFFGLKLASGDLQLKFSGGKPPSVKDEVKREKKDLNSAVSGSLQSANRTFGPAIGSRSNRGADFISKENWILMDETLISKDQDDLNFRVLTDGQQLDLNTVSKGEIIVIPKHQENCLSQSQGLLAKCPLGCHQEGNNRLALETSEAPKKQKKGKGKNRRNRNKNAPRSRRAKSKPSAKPSSTSARALRSAIPPKSSVRSGRGRTLRSNIPKNLNKRKRDASSSSSSSSEDFTDKISSFKDKISKKVSKGKEKTMKMWNAAKDSDSHSEDGNSNVEAVVTVERDPNDVDKFDVNLDLNIDKKKKPNSVTIKVEAQVEDNQMEVQGSAEAAHGKEAEINVEAKMENGKTVKDDFDLSVDSEEGDSDEMSLEHKQN